MLKSSVKQYPLKEENKMKKFISIVLVLSMLFAFAFAVSAKDSKAPLQFSEDGKFKIMQVNDTQDKHKA